MQQVWRLMLLPSGRWNCHSRVTWLMLLPWVNFTLILVLGCWADNNIQWFWHLPLLAITSAIHNNIMDKNIFPYTLWCIKICRENISFRLEEAHSSERKLVSFQKFEILLLRIYLIHYNKQDEKSTFTFKVYVFFHFNLKIYMIQN